MITNIARFKGGQLRTDADRIQSRVFDVFHGIVGEVGTDKDAIARDALERAIQVLPALDLRNLTFDILTAVQTERLRLEKLTEASS